MSKLRSDSTWAALTPEQRETLEGWLFEQNISYDEALERAQKEFGISGSKMSLVRFYQRIAEERMREEFLDANKIVEEIVGMDVNWDVVGGATLAVLTKRMLQLSLTSPHNIKEVAALGRLLVANEAMNIKRGWLEMGREKYELDTATACLIHKVKMDAIVQDESLDDGQRILKIRKELFGDNLPQ